VTLIPTTAGQFTNAAYATQNAFSTNGPPTLNPALTAITVTNGPALAIQASPPSGLLLSLTNPTGIPIEIDRSTNLFDWVFYTNVASPAWSAALNPGLGSNPPMMFFRWLAPSTP
jgi:hypothetical protein